MEWHGIKIVLPVQINNKDDMSQAFSDVNTKKNIFVWKDIYKREKCFGEFCVKRYNEDTTVVPK